MAGTSFDKGLGWPKDRFYIDFPFRNDVLDVEIKQYLEAVSRNLS